jgi:hypothetical protein
MSPQEGSTKGSPRRGEGITKLMHFKDQKSNRTLYRPGSNNSQRISPDPHSPNFELMKKNLESRNNNAIMVVQNDVGSSFDGSSQISNLRPHTIQNTIEY